MRWARFSFNVLRIAIALLLLWSAVHKASVPVDAVALARWVCSWCDAAWLVKAVTLVEWSLGSALLCGYRAQGSLVCTASLLALFTSVLFVALHTGYTGGCGCFGIKADAGGAILRNAALIAVVAITFWLGTSERSARKRRDQ